MSADLGKVTDDSTIIIRLTDRKNTCFLGTTKTGARKTSLINGAKSHQIRYCLV